MAQPENRPNLSVERTNRTMGERNKFNKMFQEKCESFNDFLTKVESQSIKCEFGEEHDSLLLVRIIAGIRNDRVRDELLSDADLTLSKAIQLCREREPASETLKRNIEPQQCTSYDESTIIRKRKLYEMGNHNGRSFSEFERSNFDCFAKTVIFPKQAKKIYINVYSTSKEQTLTLTAPLHNEYPLTITLERLETSFGSFGVFVEDLALELESGRWTADTNDELWRSWTIVMENCINLRTLRFSNCYFTSDQAHELQDRIERFIPYLEELHLLGCTGITNNWSLQDISKVYSLSLAAIDELNVNFVDHFRNLSSLTIDFAHKTAWQFSDLVRMFERTAHCLQHLKIFNVTRCNDYENIGSIITEMLSRLESLGLGFQLTDETEYMIRLPLLRSLYISCERRSINSLFQTLSEIGVIEELLINNGDFRYDNANISQLIFNKLQSFCCRDTAGILGLVRTITRSTMPIIHSFQLNGIRSNHLDELLKLVESKKSLTSIQFSVHSHDVSKLKSRSIPLQFFRQLIAIMRLAPNRPLLTLRLPLPQFNKEQVVRKIASAIIYLNYQKFRKCFRRNC